MPRCGAFRSARPVPGRGRLRPRPPVRPSRRRRPGDANRCIAPEQQSRRHQLRERGGDRFDRVDPVGGLGELAQHHLAQLVLQQQVGREPHDGADALEHEHVVLQEHDELVVDHERVGLVAALVAPGAHDHPLGIGGHDRRCRQQLREAVAVPSVHGRDVGEARLVGVLGGEDVVDEPGQGVRLGVDDPAHAAGRRHQFRERAEGSLECGQVARLGDEVAQGVDQSDRLDEGVLDVGTTVEQHDRGQPEAVGEARAQAQRRGGLRLLRVGALSDRERFGVRHDRAVGPDRERLVGDVVVRATESLRGGGLAAARGPDEADDATVVERDGGRVQHEGVAAEAADRAERDLGGEALGELRGGAHREGPHVPLLRLGELGGDAASDRHRRLIRSAHDQVRPVRPDRRAFLGAERVVELDPDGGRQRAHVEGCWHTMEPTQ